MENKKRAKKNRNRRRKGKIGNADSSVDMHVVVEKCIATGHSLYCEIGATIGENTLGRVFNIFNNL